MAPRSPDKRLVYLHCSFIFSGENAKVRKLKKVIQFLSQHKVSIRTLTSEFQLDEIAAVAKQLLEEGIFESLPRAKLRFPELFLQSGVQQTGKGASEVRAAIIEATAPYKTLPSPNEEGDGPQETTHDESDTSPPNIRPGTSSSTAHQDSATRGRVICCYLTLWERYEWLICLRSLYVSIHEPSMNPVSTLQPVYLPFKTQHRILTFAQSILEECCLEFGKTWAPDLMEAQGWDEAESIELNRWTTSFSKYAEKLPPSATRPISGKSLNQILFDTNSLRHSAVHRLPKSAPEILDMLHAACFFAEALNDTMRMARIEGIKEQLTMSIHGIVHHQSLLKRKLSGKLEDLAKKKAEIEELERLEMEDMLQNDKIKRIEAGAVIENVIADLQRASCFHTSDNMDISPSKNPPYGSEDDTEYLGKGLFPFLIVPFENEILISFPYSNSVENGRILRDHVIEVVTDSPKLLAANELGLGKERRESETRLCNDTTCNETNEAYESYNRQWRSQAEVKSKRKEIDRFNGRWSSGNAAPIMEKVISEVDADTTEFWMAENTPATDDAAPDTVVEDRMADEVYEHYFAGEECVCSRDQAMTDDMNDCTSPAADIDTSSGQDAQTYKADDASSPASLWSSIPAAPPSVSTRSSVRFDSKDATADIPATVVHAIPPNALAATQILASIASLASSTKTVILDKARAASLPFSPRAQGPTSHRSRAWGISTRISALCVRP